MNDYTWTFINPPLDEFICSHCEEVFKKPMLVGCCGSHFCEQCLQTEDKNSYVCPDTECESKGCEITAMLDKKKWKKILCLEVACPFFNQGCLWTGELEKQAEHTNYQTGDCKYATLKCTLGCGECLEKNEVDEHLKDLCPRRLVTCNYCNTQGEHKFINGEHIEQCIIECPKNCGIAKFKQCELNEHLQVCPLCVVECDYSFAGCARKGLRAEIVVHLEEYVHVHLSLLTEYFLAELETKDQLLISQNKMLSIELEKLTEVYSQELGKKNQRIEELESELENKTQYRYKQKEVEINEELKTITSNFELRHTELKLNLSQIEPNVSYLVDKEVELKYLLHRGKKNTEIWKGIHNETPVVVKKPLPGASDTDILLEAQILKKLYHKNVIKMLNAITDIKNVSIIMEYMSCGNLDEYIKNNVLLLHEQISVCRQVATGLDYLHIKLCMHRKIRVDNVLITKELQCKINDFSLAKIVSKHDDYVDAKQLMVRIKWSAPEVHKANRYYLKTDVWAFGILIWQVIMNGEDPFPGLSNVEAEKHIIEGIPMIKPKQCSENFYTIMKNCWVVDPWSRPTFEALTDLLDHVKDSHKYTDIN